ncbi:MAG TPA: malto-oligosyltrehalose trehalohydrolase, partial [Tepidiformaceae bacterium]|nr:malto-oligosyltrehalose trehalohydrolase [Tepidiformaceae bacterium]
PTAREVEYRVARVTGLAAGQRYAYRVDGNGPFPDPCSRSQPLGVHGPSELVDPAAFRWSDQDFVRPRPQDLVIYECHIGTLTPGGTFDAAVAEFARIRSLGVTALEVMPVASFPGRWNWGYDGAALFAPAAVYGGPDGFRTFVNAAHAAGLAVILDVVFNHFGPDGNYTGVYSGRYLTARHATPWGDAVNFDDAGSREVRRFVIENVLHWHYEYHVDGFRFDATHAIFDDSSTHILAEVRDALTERHRGPIPPLLIAETHENDVRYLRSRDVGGFGFDAVWADDFHHAARTLVRPEHEGYLRSYSGTPEELARTIEHGFLYEGQLDEAFGSARGTPARDRLWAQFVYCLQNHDQVGNRAFGDRMAVAIGRDRQLALTVLLLLLPQTPLLFQGQEWCTTTPFQYFTDHEPQLGAAVTDGRRREFAGFHAFRDESARLVIPDPQDPATFERSQLDSRSEQPGLAALSAAFHRELLRLRAEDPVLRAAREGRTPLSASVENGAIVVDVDLPQGRRLIVLNVGPATSFPVHEGSRAVLSSTDQKWGGPGSAVRMSAGALCLPPDCGVFVSVRD